ncbi:Transcription factor [Penicillium griseofulvum]|uniref:Transcription factor n=1 Tax=Penicillium patulum TaxID=5078 RepID=A0A135LCG2_PENPA|nr:Transcription factor [Penicillium griseofulvum]KXG46657.1 Transcription factor [Penicillium griseofulvum]
MIAILHLATTAQLVEDASDGLSLDPASEALLLSICFAAVVSTKPEQLHSGLGLDYQSTVRHYEEAVNQALNRADFVKSAEILALQAAVLYLLCKRVHGDEMIVWAQSAVLIRLAQMQGVHRDGMKIGLSPFETEIRRRIWWHICILDMLCSEDQGVDMQIRPGAFDTNFPTNVDGDDLESDMIELPPEKKGFTDITLCIISCFMINDVHLSTRPLGSVPSMKDREH